MRRSALIIVTSAAIALGGCQPKAADQAAPKAEQTAAESNDCVKLKDWKWDAWVDTMPIGGKPTLHVTGSTQVSTSGWTASLTDKGLDKSNPPTQIFDLVVHAPTGMVNQVMSTLEARADIIDAQPHYAAVDILCGRTTVAHVPVKETSKK